MSTTEMKRDLHGAYLRPSRDSKYDRVMAVPCEIEMSHELYEAITMGLGDTLKLSCGTLERFIQERFLERMEQIFSDPAEFGKLFLDDFKRAHCLYAAPDIEIRDD